MHTRECILRIFLNYNRPIQQNEVGACDGLNDLLKINLHFLKI